MLDIKYVIENKELIINNCKDRNVNVNIEELVALDEEKRGLQTKIDDLRSHRNKNSKQKPDKDEIKQMRLVGEEIKQLEAMKANFVEKINDIMHRIPNLTHPDSPIGGEDDYRVIYTNTEPNEFEFEPLNHDELMLDNELINFEKGANVAGSKFYYFQNEAVLLNMALLRYGIDICSKYGYKLLETPDMANGRVLEASGFNPRGEEKQIYEIKDHDLSLIGTAEITVLGYHADEIIDLNDGPKKYVALSHCFRIEAGAYGKTSKGLYRVHQFTKLEMFIFCKPEESEKYHQELLDIEKEIVGGLEIPYRVIDIASGDLGGPAYRKYDVEAWMTMLGDEKKQGGYGEITSTSNCTDYQARRLNIKYKNKDGKNKLVHTLNGTAIVLSRFPIMIVENHQQKDGSIKIPTALVKYTGFDSIKKK